MYKISNTCIFILLCTAIASYTWLIISQLNLRKSISQHCMSSLVASYLATENIISIATISRPDAVRIGIG